MKWKPIKYIQFWFWYYANEQDEGRDVPWVWYVCFLIWFCCMMPVIEFTAYCESTIKEEKRKKRFNQAWKKYKETEG